MSSFNFLKNNKTTATLKCSKCQRKIKYTHIKGYTPELVGCDRIMRPKYLHPLVRSSHVVKLNRDVI